MLAGAVDDVRGGDQEAVAREHDAAPASPIGAQMGDRGEQALAGGDHDARVRIEGVVVVCNQANCHGIRR